MDTGSSTPVDTAPTNQTATTAASAPATDPTSAAAMNVAETNDKALAPAVRGMYHHVNKLLGRTGKQTTPAKKYGKGGPRSRAIALAFDDNKKTFHVVARSMSRLRQVTDNDIVDRFGRRLSTARVSLANRNGKYIPVQFRGQPAHLVLATPGEVAKLQANSTKNKNGGFSFGRPPSQTQASAPFPPSTASTTLAPPRTPGKKRRVKNMSGGPYNRRQPPRKKRPNIVHKKKHLRPYIPPPFQNSTAP